MDEVKIVKFFKIQYESLGRGGGGGINNFARKGDNPEKVGLI